VGLGLVDRCPGRDVDHEVVTGHHLKTGLGIADVHFVSVDCGHLVSTR